ncbi:gluconate transporter [Jeongeupia chitinilytica]|uniref:Gluconate transporter n=1 Tax=Jeongeupia chitinilytica TaxID=1041641 RepID=A0ABQ3GXG5_9NEIS|nr:gluconate transporter [Jeongeupia chitinilytica]GHD59918.1 gluconate transporter [Jeongeupia chitinilytica]
MSNLSLILNAAGSIVLLLALVMKLRLHAFVALILVSMIVGITAGMNPARIADTIQSGMGDTLGFVATVVALGTMFGKMMEATGALDRIALTLLGKFGERRASWALAVIGLICSLPLFFGVAVVLLIGVVFALARRSGGNVVGLGLALLAGIGACQSFLIPAAPPILVASQLNADFGWMIVLGLATAIPATVLAGPLYGRFISKFVSVPLPAHALESHLGENKGELPSFSLALCLMVLPLLLVGLKTVAVHFVEPDSTLYNWLQFIGHPFTAIMFSCLSAFYLLGVQRGMSRNEIMNICSAALEPAGIIILVTGAGGVFKQVLVDSGVGSALGNMLAGAGLPVTILAFTLAAAVRVIQGSATVAMLTACGLIQPMIEYMHLNGAQLAAVTIAIGGGAVVLSHVNDSGFWLASRYLGMTEKQTLQTWTVMETIIGVTGGVVATVAMVFL